MSPRFGAEIIGGAEAVVRDIALGLVERDWSVEVLTTCAVNPYTWANELPESTKVQDGILVRRFENVLAASASKEHAVHGRIYAGEVPSLDDQVTWLNALFRTPGLFEALLREKESFDAVIFAPYLFWTTTVCMPAVADRAVVMPCLHDEVYAYLDVMRHVLSLPASVWFLSGPEHDLAHRMGPVTPNHTVIGSGMQVPKTYRPEKFRSEYGIDSPFLLYVGRREADKGWPWLVDLFSRTEGAGQAGERRGGGRRGAAPAAGTGDRRRLAQHRPAQQRPGCGPGLRPAEPQRELLAHRDGVVAGVPARAGPQGQHRRRVALFPQWGRRRLRDAARTGRSRGTAAGGQRHGRRRWASEGGLTCSRTISGRTSST